jgi:hypothetical protein
MLGEIGMSELLIVLVVALLVFVTRRDGTAPPDGVRADTPQLLKEPRPC